MSASDPRAAAEPLIVRRSPDLKHHSNRTAQHVPTPSAKAVYRACDAHRLSEQLGDDSERVEINAACCTLIVTLVSWLAGAYAAVAAAMRVLSDAGG